MKIEISDYAKFNEIPVHSVFIFGIEKFIKLADAIPDVGTSKQPPNCLNLQTQHYCTMSASHKVKLVKKISEYSNYIKQGGRKMKLKIADLRMQVEPTGCNNDINIYISLKGTGDELDYEYLAELDHSKEEVQLVRSSDLKELQDRAKINYGKYDIAYILNQAHINLEPVKVIFNGPATIVFWNDGSKTVVKCQNKDKFDMEKGFAMACTKKLFGNEGNYYNRFREVSIDFGIDLYVPKETENGQT